MKTILTDTSSTQDRLNVAFAALRKQGLLARQNFSCCMGCATYELATDIRKMPSRTGAVYYHKQAGANLRNEHSFPIGFACRPELHEASDEASVLAAANKTREIGWLAFHALQAAGLQVEWTGSPEETISVTPAKTLVGQLRRRPSSSIRIY